MIKNVLIVGLGGAIGSIFRYLLGRLSNKYWENQFPLSTFIVNLIGCLFIGILIGIFSKNNNDSLKLLLITGFCGGFTTFSSFASENINLLQNNQVGLAFVNITGSIIFGLLAVWVGIALVKA